MKRARRGTALPALLLGGVATAIAGTAGDGSGAIAFPHDYRAWAHVKSGLIDDPAHPGFPRFGGLHHIYANPVAMSGYRHGDFPDGSILVYDLHELRALPDGSIDQGPRRHVDVMLKDRSRFAATGGWGYEEFAGGDPSRPLLTPQARAGCASCHARRSAHDHVFSEYRE